MFEPCGHALRRVSIAGATLACLALAACASDAAPRAPSAQDAPPTIVSLNPCLDAILVEIAEPDQVLALSHYSRDAAASSIPQAVADRFRATGGTAEEVIALAPDIVLASRFIAPATRRAFEQVGIRVETFDSPTSILASIAQVERIGAITDREDAARRLAGLISQAPAAPAGARKVSALLWQPGQIVAGKQTLVHDLLARTGFASHAAMRGLDQADHVALESVIADPPEVLLVAGDSVGQNHPSLVSAPDMVVSRLDPHLVYCGGPTIVRLAARLAQIREGLDQ